MDSIKIKNVIDRISKVITIPDDKKEELLIKSSSLSEIEAIKKLSQIAYRVLGNNEELLDYALEVIRSIDSKTCPSVYEMKIRLSRMFSNDIDGNMSLEENHKLVSDSLVKFTTLFNKQGIDYYVVGALPCFIKTGQKLFRYHDDIDIMVNEDDIPKVAEIVGLVGYEFHDDRFPSLERCKEIMENKPPHTVLAQNPDNEFHIGFFTFRREEDNSITMREYSHQIEGENVVTNVLERQSDPIGTNLRYDEEKVNYMGTTFRTSSIENVYSLKGYTRRPKDISDMQRLESFVDKKKLEALKEHPNRNIELHNVRLENKERQIL